MFINMSNTIGTFFKSNPFMVKYVQTGLVNIMSLARYIKNSNKAEKNASIAAIGMEIRRYVSRLPIQNKLNFNTDVQNLHLVTRSNLQELIFIKNPQNREYAHNIFNKISKTKYFSCIVEGDKEITLITDFDVEDFLKDKILNKMILYHTTGLGFVSVDFPIKLRKVVGVYSYVLSALQLADISIHSFHTIGGEILILVKNGDLIKTQEVLTSALKI